MSQSGSATGGGSGAGFIETLTGNSGGAVGPDGAFNIDILGDNNSGINIVGTPASSLLTVYGLQSTETQRGTVELATAVETGQLASSSLAVTPAGLGSILVTPFVVAPGGAYTTIQSAIDAATLAGGNNIIWVRPGSYTEDLNITSSITLASLDGFVVLTGQHTPPTSGTVNFDGLVLISATNIFNSNAAGSTIFNVNNCFVIITNGYVFNLPNWTGEILMDNCGEASTNDGLINNVSGSSNIKLINVEGGAGSGNTMQLNCAGGFLRFDTVNINCPVTMGGSGNVISQNGNRFGNTVTIGGSLSGYAIDTNFRTGSAQALVYNSSGDFSISNGEVQSTNNPAIGGTGAGTLTLTNISFLDNSVLAGTLTLGTSSVYPMNMTDGQLLIGATGQPAVASTLTAGAGISISNGAGSITISATGSDLLTYTEVTPGMSPYTVLAADEYLGVDCTGGVVTILLPDAPSTGRVIYIKDKNGQAAVNAITVTTVSGVVTIDSALSQTMNTAFRAIQVIFNGVSYEVF